MHFFHHSDRKDSYKVYKEEVRAEDVSMGRDQSKCCFVRLLNAVFGGHKELKMLFQSKAKSHFQPPCIILAFLALMVSLNHFAVYEMFKFAILVNET